MSSITFMGDEMQMRTSVTAYKREEVVELAYKLGFEYEKNVHYCPQASLAALMDVFQIRDDVLFKSLFAFHGGGGNSGIGSCGALVGGIAVISYFFGRTKQEFDLAVENCHATGYAKILVDLFGQEFGGIRCRDCQKKMFGREIDFWKEEDKRIFEEMKGHEEKCPTVVGKGASLAAGIIWDALHETEPVT